MGTQSRFVRLAARPTVDVAAERAFETRAMLKYGVSRSSWFKQGVIKSYHRLVFDPDGCDSECLNLWVGWQLTPAAGSCELFPCLIFCKGLNMQSHG